jgi:hypothetical protein
MLSLPILKIRQVEFFERDVLLRLPFSFGVVNLQKAPQVFIRVAVEFRDARTVGGVAAEMLVPKWFDKRPELSNERNCDQLRMALAVARDLYVDGHDWSTAFGLHVACYHAQIKRCYTSGLNSLIAGYGTALLDRAILDALCRHCGVSFFECVKVNLPGISVATTPDLAGFDVDRFLARLRPARKIFARHTVGLADAITDADVNCASEKDGLPRTLWDCIRVYGNRYFKLKVAGNIDEDLDRLRRIAAVLDQIEEPYWVTLDGNEQYRDAPSINALLKEIESDSKLARLTRSLLFIEQPLPRSITLETDIGMLAAELPVEIDESDNNIDAFCEARRLGYSGISSKSCKGPYRSILNRARCQKWNADETTDRYFMSAEDLMTQAGLSVQQDLALATLIGCTHVERNGHHYVNGFSAAPADEQDTFLSHFPELYVRSNEAVRLKIQNGTIALDSLSASGFASAAEPNWASLRRVAYSSMVGEDYVRGD